MTSKNSFWMSIFVCGSGMHVCMYVCVYHRSTLAIVLHIPSILFLEQNLTLYLEVIEFTGGLTWKSEIF